MTIVVNRHALSTRQNNKEHYELLACISYFMNNKLIIDAGTYQGLSAAHLAVNTSNKIVSYDIEDKNVNLEWISKPNITFKKMAVLDDLEFVLCSDLIFLDIDPHDGIQEQLISDALIKRNYTGVVIADDIHYFEGMRTWWKSLPGIKIDLTSLGHFSGTGLWILPSTKVDISII